MADNMIYGKITDIIFKNPAAYATVELMGTEYKTQTDTAGNYKLINIPDGKYQLIVSSERYYQWLNDIDIKGDTTFVLNISLLRIGYFVDGPVIILPVYFVTATRTDAELQNLPGSNQLITSNQIKNFPANNVDEILLSNASISPDRDKGIFSKNSSVTMRGLNGSYRTLILLDGLPINKTDGGGINWNRINPATIDKIEISEGPGSALYGGNAMGGVINIISKIPDNKIEGNIRGSLGTYNTTGLTLNLQGSQNPYNTYKGFYWGINSFYRNGKGYVAAPDSTRDSTDVALAVREFNAGVKIGYRFNYHHLIEVGYDWYDDKRGDGVRVYDPDGGYFKYTTNFIRSKYHYIGKKIVIDFNGFYQLESYFNQKESLKREKTPPFPVSKYVLYKTESDRIDKGLMFNISRKMWSHHNLTSGIDIKFGSVDGSDIYFTSTDTVTNKGKMNFYAAFVQDEINLFDNKLNIIGGLRLDIANFHAGSFRLKSPTAETDILVKYAGPFDDTSWYAISPKLALQYKFKDNLKLYISFSRGFRPPILDDMCRNGNITKGIKLANPELKPETIDNFEFGGKIWILKKVYIQPAIYYSIGNDFQYFVGTGDTNYSGTKPKPVLKRENISQVSIKGAEISLNYYISDKFTFRFSYSHTQSIIKKFDLSKYPAKDLTGKVLMEVPPNLVFASLTWQNRYLTTTLVYRFKDLEYMDDENLQKVLPHSIVDIKIRSCDYKGFSVSLSIQNLANTEYCDNKGQLGLGRYFMGEIEYEF